MFSSLPRPAQLLARSATLGVGLAVVLGGVVGASPARAAGSSLVVSVAGSGSSCAVSAPCSIQIALDLAQAGDTVQLQAGSYPAWDLQDRSGHLRSAASNVTVRPAPGAAVTVTRIASGVAHLSLTGFTVAPGGVDLNQAAEYSLLDGMEVDGSAGTGDGERSVQIQASHTAILRSYLHDRIGANHIFLGGGGQPITDVQIQGNRIGAAPVGAGGAHVDCLQLGGLDSDIRIVDNVFYDCAASELMIKADYGPIDNVLIANNIMRQCDRTKPGCNGYYALYVVSSDSPVVNSAHFPVTNITVAHNTIDGGIELENRDPSFRFIGNTVAGLSYGQDLCSPNMQYNAIGTTGCTNSLPPSNHIGPLDFTDPQHLDYRLKPTSSAIGVGGPLLPTTDLTGQPRNNPTTAGAVQAVSLRSERRAGTALRHRAGDGPSRRAMLDIAGWAALSLGPALVLVFVLRRRRPRRSVGRG